MMPIFLFRNSFYFPRTLELDPGSFQVIKEINPFLIKLGFDIKYLNKNTIVIDGVTDDISAGFEEKVLLEIVDEYTN